MAAPLEAGDVEVVTVRKGAERTGTTAEYNIAGMTILALETATRAGSVALARDGTIVARTGNASRTHGERLPGELLDLLREAGARLADVDAFAVVLGPGLFTGLRVGVAAIQGLALATGKPVVGCPALELMADAWLDRHHDERPDVLAACLDGQRGDVFFAAWRPAREGLAEDAGPVVEPSVGRPADLARALEPHVARGRVVIAGDGARRYQEELMAVGTGVSIDDVPAPLAEMAARRALRHPDEGVAPHALRPIYIRRPDAVIARERAAGAGEPRGFAISRASGAEDLSEIEALQRRAFTNAWGAEAIRWELQNTDVARLYVMRDPEGALVAYCACWLLFDELHVNSLAVEESRRRKGLGRRLLHHVFREAVEAGARSATLEVRQSNTAARALYQGLGFRVEAVRRNYYQDPHEDALILWHRHLAAVAAAR